jgi:hypothetical protein
MPRPLGHQRRWHLAALVVRTSCVGVTREVAAQQLRRHHGPTLQGQAQERRLSLSYGRSRLTPQACRLLRTMAPTQNLTCSGGTGTILAPLQQLHSSQHLAITPTLHHRQVHNQALSQAVLSSTDTVVTPVLPATSRSMLTAMDHHKHHRQARLAQLLR